MGTEDPDENSAFVYSLCLSLQFKYATLIGSDTSDELFCGEIQ